MLAQKRAISTIISAPLVGEELLVISGLVVGPHVVGDCDVDVTLQVRVVGLPLP
jgi:hypothetical protein